MTGSRKHDAYSICWSGGVGGFGFLQPWNKGPEMSLVHQSRSATAGPSLVLERPGPSLGRAWLICRCVISWGAKIQAADDQEPVSVISDSHDFLTDLCSEKWVHCRCNKRSLLKFSSHEQGSKVSVDDATGWWYAKKNRYNAMKAGPSLAWLKAGSSLASCLLAQ